jgi:pyridoxine 5-phosphate synthase
MAGKKLKLGVNVDHVATLRQVRGTTYPDVLEAAWLCEAAGAHGITAHLREDRRHIQDDDIFLLLAGIQTRLNLEMANVPEIVEIALRLGPDEVCIVPERREELTTEGGLDVVGQRKALTPTVAELSARGIEVSLFIEPDAKQVRAAAAIGAPCIELHTGTFCEASGAVAKRELQRLVVAARLGRQLGLRVNAGHGINLANIGAILKVPGLDTLNIGHSIVSRAVYVGMRSAVREMLKAMQS